MSANRGFRWNPESQQFDLVDLDGRPIANIRNGILRGMAGIALSAVGSVADGRIQRLILGGAGAATLSFANKVVATLPLTNVGTNLTAVATLVGSIQCAVADSVKVNLKDAPVAGFIIGGVRVPTTNTVVLDLTCPRIDTAASQPAVGADVFVVR